MNVLVLNPQSQITKNVLRDLVYGCWCKGKRIGGMEVPPTSLLYIATIIKNNNHNVRLLDAAAEQKTPEDLKKIIQDYEVVIISTSTMSFIEDAYFLEELKNINKNLITIVFGSHPTFAPYHTLDKKSIDIIVRREPEFIIRDLINALDKKDNSWKKVKGIGFREGNKKIINELYDFVDINELPIPDRTMLPKDIDYFNPIIKRMPYTTMITSRGCPARCTFCTVPNFYGSKIRVKTAEKVIEELEIIQGLGYKEVWLRDETFTAYPARNRVIFEEMIKRKIDLTWICNARVGILNEEMVLLMKKAGGHMIKFGVESGSQKILDNIKKGIKITETEKTFKMLNKLGMDTHAHVMLGAPGETKETIKETINFIKKIDPTTASFGICTPYMGTDLFNEVSKNHPEIKDGSACDLSKLHEKGFFNKYYTELTDKELENSIKKAYRSFYFRPQYIFKWLPKIKNIDELKRLTLAGTNVFSFTVTKD